MNERSDEAIRITVLALDLIARAELNRATLVTVDPEAGIAIRVASAEDTVAQKLLWYRRGGETSERQWLDVLSVLAVQRDRLDLAYLRQVAEALDVADLLARALADAAAGPQRP